MTVTLDLDIEPSEQAEAATQMYWAAYEARAEGRKGIYLDPEFLFAFSTQMLLLLHIAEQAARVRSAQLQQGMPLDQPSAALDAMLSAAQFPTTPPKRK